MILVKTYWVIPPIIDGTKSQTRRFTDPNLKAGSIHVMKRFLSDRSFARVRIRRVWQEHLGDMTDEDAIAEGYHDRIDNVRGICRAHCNRGTLGMTTRQWMKVLDDIENGVSKGPMLWVIEFELVEALWDPSHVAVRETRG